MSLPSIKLGSDVVWFIFTQARSIPGVSNLLASLGHTGRRVVLGHILNTQTLTKTNKKSHNVLNKFTILCWAAFIAILGYIRPGVGYP